LTAAVDRIEVRLDRTGDCWLWSGGTNGRGYGVIGIKTGEGRKIRMRYIHRLMYERHVGSIPDGMEIDHLCLVRNCGNPAHLEVVTHAENCRRYFSTITHCPRGHEYTADNTHINPSNNKRHCRTCDRDKTYIKRQSVGERRGPHRRWSDEEIMLILNNPSTKDLSEKFGVNRTTIQRIRRSHSKAPPTAL